MSEGAAIMSVRIDKETYNLPTIATVLGGAAVTIIVNAFALGVLYANFDNRITSLKATIDGEISQRVERGKISDESFASIQAQLPAFNQMQWQQTRMNEEIASLHKSDQEISERMSRYIEANSTKLEKISDDVGNIRTQVEVIGSKLDGRIPKKFGAIELPASPVSMP